MLGLSLEEANTWGIRTYGMFLIFFFFFFVKQTKEDSVTTQFVCSSFA